jgi:hypothetical protein
MRIGSTAIAPFPGPRARVLTYAEDSSTGPVVEDQVEVAKIGRRLDGPRVGVWDQTTTVASADKDGNYLFGPESRKFDQVQAFTSAQKTLDLFEGYAGRSLPWAFDAETLGVGPHAGEGANAYYQRSFGAISFYSFPSKALGKTVHTSQSAETVAHETGHAILDGLKPQYGHTFDRETKAFHEAFGDCAAMLLTLSRPGARARILSETGGDLTRENAATRFSEEFGTAVRRANRDPGDDRDYLRTALNPFRYADPASLPYDGPRDVLTGESHSFCQIWTKAFYQGLAGVFRQEQAGLTADAALVKSAQVMGDLLTASVQMVSPARARYADLARAMLKADALLSGGRNRSVLRTAFEDAGIACDLAPVPELAWNEPVTNPVQAQEFLKQNAPVLGIDADRYQGYRVSRDKHGLTHAEYLNRETFQLGDFATDVRSGLTLTFDDKGDLVHLTRDPVTPEILDSERTGIVAELRRPAGKVATWTDLRPASYSGPGAWVEALPNFECGHPHTGETRQT